jgi:carbamoyl-phosphate synthase large subunit
MIKTVLISGIGGDIGQGVARLVRRYRPETRIIGLDISTNHCGFSFVDTFELVPRPLRGDYKESILRLIEKFKADLFIPNSEAELETVVEWGNEIQGARILTCGKEVVKVGVNKKITSEALESLGIEGPWTVDGQEKPLNYPCVMKPTKGSGSRNIFQIDNCEDAMFFRKKFPLSIFQELLVPNFGEVTCGVYRKKTGEINVLSMLRRLTGGFTSWFRVIDDTNVKQVCAKIADKLKLVGSMNVQLMLTEKGPMVFEINPRFSSTIEMRDLIGFKDVLWALNDIENIQFNYPEIECGIEVAKFFQAQILKHRN